MPTTRPELGKSAPGRLDERIGLATTEIPDWQETGEPQVRIVSPGPVHLKFSTKFELFDLAMKLLRFTPEVHAPQLGDDQLQMFDLCVEACHQRLHRRSIQHVYIGRRRARIKHDLNMP
jgi:hypothetical protein